MVAVGFAWHAEGPGVEPGAMREKKKKKIPPGFGPLPSSSLKHLHRVRVIQESTWILTNSPQTFIPGLLQTDTHLQCSMFASTSSHD